MPWRGGYPASGRGGKPTSARVPKVIGLPRNGDRLAPESVIGLPRNGDRLAAESVIGLGRNMQLAVGRRATALDPDFVNALELVGYSLFEKGKLAAGIAVIERAIEIADFPIVMGNLGRMYGRVGRIDDANRVLGNLRARAEREYVPASSIANVYSGLGDYEQADIWMNKAFANREGHLSILNVVSDEHTRANPYYTEWLQKIGLPNL